MLSRAELMSIRRSAAMSTLSPADTVLLLDTCEALLGQREQIATLLQQLPASFGQVRDVLNKLASMVG